MSSQKVSLVQKVSVHRAQEPLEVPRILKLGTLEKSRAPAQFQALVQGTRAQVLFDTGADDNFVSETFASAKGLIVTEAAEPLQVQVADGRTVTVDRVCKLFMKFSRFKTTVKAYVLPSGCSKLDVILGDPWLHDNNATIAYNGRSVKVTMINASGSLTLEELSPLRTASPEELIAYVTTRLWLSSSNPSLLSIKKVSKIRSKTTGPPCVYGYGPFVS